MQLDGRWVLRDLDLAVRPGQHVAVLGESGAGKSTLFGFLLGWYGLAAGRCEIDGRSYDAGLPPELLHATAWAAPEAALWDRSLLDNLCAGGAPPPAAPAEALRAAGLLDLLGQLPAGLRTRLGEDGRRLSGGEAQRLRLARALLRPGVRLALLDEPFRGLDAGRRAALLAAARAHWRRATLLCITHSPAEALAFDRLLVLERGRLVESGSPRRLAAQPASRFRAMLDAESAADCMLRRPAWRRLHLAGGRLAELPPAPARHAAPPAGSFPPPTWSRR